MKFLELTPQIFTIENFLSKEECQKWIDFSEEKGYEEAPISTGRGQVMNKEVRNNERIIYDSLETAQWLWERAKELVPQEINHATAIGLNARLRFYKYYPGQQFKKHMDGSFVRNIHEWSAYTFMIYLNEEMEGGATKFQDCVIQPQTGLAVIFKHRILHEGSLVYKGVKYVLRTDVMYRRHK